jgi:DNA-binding response OmpR family regulator
MAHDAGTILVVDDDSDLLHMLKDLLEDQGYRVLLASDGIEALEVLDGNPVDCVISDVRMPRMTGLEMLIKLRAKGHIATPVILTSGFSDLTPEQAVAQGALDLLAKPFDFPLLMMRIAAACRRLSS